MDGRFGHTLAAALAAMSVALPCAAQEAGAPATGDAHLDALIGTCRPAVDAYGQALAAANPPEVVDLTIRSLLSSLRGVGGWSDGEIAKRQAMDGTLISDPDLARANPTGAQAARLDQCVVGAELAARVARTGPK
jgi:hypothetical protein